MTDDRRSTKRKGSEQFGRLPYAMIDAGLYAGMKRAEALTLIAIAGHVKKKDWTAWPSIPRIARLAGLSTRSVERAIVSLEAKGLMTYERGGGREHPNIYQLTTNPDDSVGVSDDQTPASPSPRPRQTGTETPASQSLNPGTATPGEQKENIKQQQNRDAAAESSPTQDTDSAVVKLLTSEGIGEPKRSEIASMPGMTVAAVRACWKKEGIGSSARQGMRVRAIENHAHDVMKAMARREQDRREAQEREADERAALKPQIDEALDRLDPKVLECLKKDTLRIGGFGSNEPSEDDIRFAMFKRLKTYGEAHYANLAEMTEAGKADLDGGPST